MIGFSYEYLSNNAMCTVFINNNRAGSAFLFLHNEKIYALTAYHCVFDDNTDRYHDNYFIGYDKDNPFVIEVLYPQDCNVEQKAFAKNNDIALVSIKSGECYKRNILNLHPFIKLSSINSYSIIGYPSNISTNQLIELDVKYIHGLILCNEFNLTKKEEISKIKGFSGGIVCEKNEDVYYFCGLVSKALSEEFEYNYIKCPSCDAINKVLDTINCQIPVTPECCYKEKSQFYQLLEKVLKKREFINNWVNGDIASEIETTINGFLMSEDSDNRICTFVGLSGIGKTRSVLEACRKLRSEFTIYYDRIENFRKDANSKWIDDENLTIIIDELKLGEWEEIYNCYTINKCKIILIATIPGKTINEYSKSLAGFHSINSTTNEDMKRIISAQHHLLQEEEIEQICSLSFRDLRLALLISDLYSHDRRINLTSFSSTSIIANYGTAEKILEKTLSLFGKETGTLSRIYQELSTLVDVGYAGAAKEECEFLACYFKNSINDYIRAIHTFSESNLGIENEYYFKAMPIALSKLAFEKYIWPLLSDNINEFISGLPNTKSKRRFLERIYECEIASEEVDGAFAPYFQDRFGKQTILEAFLSKPDEISLYIEFNPEKGLDWIEKSLKKNTGY